MDDRTSPDKPARAVPANTNDTPGDPAPLGVAGNPSSDTQGSTGTSTREGPPRPAGPIDDKQDRQRDHRKSRGSGNHEVDPPGERVDDLGGGQRKVLKRQE